MKHTRISGAIPAREVYVIPRFMKGKDTVGNLFLDHFVVRFICLSSNLKGRYGAIEYGFDEFAYILHLCVEG